MCPCQQFGVRVNGSAASTCKLWRMAAGLFAIDTIMGFILGLAVAESTAVIRMTLSQAQLMLMGAPITALILQPMVGAVSDSCTSKLIHAPPSMVLDANSSRSAPLELWSAARSTPWLQQ